MRVILIILCLSLPRVLFAMGGISEGGAKSVVCRNLHGELISAELLDLAEARELYHLKPAAVYDDIVQSYWRSQLRSNKLQGINGIDPGFANYRLPQFFSRMRLIEGDPGLELIDDVGKTIDLPPGCKLEQLAVFDDHQKKIEVSGALWRALDSRNRAALVQHELFYHDRRLRGDRTSEETRFLVGLIFSGDPISSASDFIPASAQKCVAVDSITGDRTDVFYLYPDDERENMLIQFIELMGRPVLTRSLIRVPVASWDVIGKKANGRSMMISKRNVQPFVATLILESFPDRKIPIEIEIRAGSPMRLGRSYVKTCSMTNLNE